MGCRLFYCYLLFILKLQIALGVPVAGGGHMGQQAVARGQGVERQILRNAPLVQNQRTVEEMVHVLDIMGREQQCFAAGEGGAHQLDEVPPCKGVLAQKRLVHQVVGHPLGKARGQLHPGALAGGKAANHIAAVQGEELQKFCIPRRVKCRVQVGQQLLCAIKNRDVQGRIVLTLRELLGTWSENAACFAAGETVVGIVRSVEEYGVFIEIAPNLAGLAEADSTLRPGQAVSVYIKNILPDKMKIKLVVVNKNLGQPLRFEPHYFVTRGRLKRWTYSTPQSRKQIETVF